MPTEMDADRVGRMTVQVARHQGWVRNPDTELTRRIEAGLLVNHQRYGYFLCPCRDGDGDRTADKDIVCPCTWAQADIDEYGQCFCGLYLAPDWQERQVKPGSIPERRPC